MKSLFEEMAELTMPENQMLKDLTTLHIVTKLTDMEDIPTNRKTIELGDRDVETLIDALSVRVLTLGEKLESNYTLPADKIRIQSLLHETKQLFHRIHFIK